MQRPENQRAAQVADTLNHGCFCFDLNPDALSRALESALGSIELADEVRERAPHLFARQPVFVNAAQLQRIADVVAAVEAVVALPAYREQILATSAEIVRLGPPGPRGAFFGYDFHADGSNLSLIEINTNAGGALLNAALARAERATCPALSGLVPTNDSVLAFEARIVAMFRNEWRLAGQHRALKSIAIVDEAPERQYLHPEFLLFERLFAREGLVSVIADPSALDWRDGRLWHGELQIDLVYNRLTDFYLEQPGSASLREAYVRQAIVLTPNPRAHALYADKHRLAVFSDAAQLEALGVPRPVQLVLLEHVPRTRIVDAVDESLLWAERRHLFFKPTSGFGSRAAYRGDKLTRRVWREILAGDYVAQELVMPGERNAGGGQASLKYDLRAYAYDGEVQWVAARLYQGQTTNFRTPGGGFAPVYSTTDATPSACCSQDQESLASYVFVLDEADGVHPLPHALYLSLARGKATAPEWAGATVRLADWYVRLKDGEPDAVANETYSLMSFDAEGRVDWSRTPSPHPHRAGVERVGEDAAWPTTAQREQMTSLLFRASARE